MYFEEKIWMSMNQNRQYLLPIMANRHGLIAGATGTGKTITLKVMAESFSDMGVPVFMADVKGDLTGMCIPGVDSESMQKRIKKFGLNNTNYSYAGYPTTFWDIYGEKGTPVRTTVSEMGPLLLAHAMNLNDTQTGVLEVIFKVADDEKLLLLDLKDLKAILNYVAEHASELRTEYGNIASSTVGAITRGVIQLEQQGGDLFFGEPALDLKDWMRIDKTGKGYINILNSVKLFQNPALYTTFLLWLLSELYEILPEIGDVDKPKMIFYFDEAHLLFDNASKELLQKVEQIVRLIRSKGVGVFFVTQKPTDISEDVLAQLGNRIQHGLHAYTPKEQKAIKAVADSFCANPEVDTKSALLELGTGEALVSFLDEAGRPTPVERTFILPPQSFMGAASDEEWQAVLAKCEMNAKYETMIDRESAYEVLVGKAEALAKENEAEALKEENEKLKKQLESKESTKESKSSKKTNTKLERELESGLVRIAKAALPRSSYSRKKSTADRVKDTTINVVGGEVVRTFVRGIFGNFVK
ncbi:helicase HerA-like domain-containing protein [Anaerorhabdus furcosa]|uniref:Helicase HerA-like C-terminal domain-containing protein n=1 Tax=Anaerorhabdus furcosa TaxID=118967 RepID=A0A1T4Q1C6_9FIRM|nr:helicase HerA-like domain-containing protein [Anaerorhabdus furcosa]SJZ97630.1 hypothetical protein SAMN02745191_2263 [Anaerorhabdus furcosa]